MSTPQFHVRVFAQGKKNGRNSKLKGGESVQVPIPIPVEAVFFVGLHTVAVAIRQPLKRPCPNMVLMLAQIRMRAMRGDVEHARCRSFKVTSVRGSGPITCAIRVRVPGFFPFFVLSLAAFRRAWLSWQRQRSRSGC